MSSGDNLGNAELAPAARAAVATTSSKKYDKPISTSSAAAPGAKLSNDSNNNSKRSTAGTMRVKVTGDDGSRNGPPSSGGPPTAVRSVAGAGSIVSTPPQENVKILEKPLVRSKFLGGTPDGRIIVQPLDGLLKNANGGPLPKPTKPTGEQQQRTEAGPVVAQTALSVVLHRGSNASNGSGANLSTTKQPLTMKIMVSKESVIPDKAPISVATVRKATAVNESVLSNGNAPGDIGGEFVAAPPTETEPSTKERQTVSALPKQSTLPSDPSSSADGEQSGGSIVASAGGDSAQEESFQLGSEFVSKMPREMKQLEIATKASKFFSNDSANQSLPSPHALRLRDRSRTKSPSNQRLSTAASLTRAPSDCFDEEESSTNSTDLSSISTTMGSSVSSLMKRYSIGSSASATQLVLGPEAPPPKPGSDRYCWKCKKPNFLLSLSPKSGMVSCSTCPRSFHAGCIKAYYATAVWRCNECYKVDPLGPSAATSGVVDHIKMANLQKCLDYALIHILDTTNGKLLFNPFDKSACSGYDEKVSHHVDLCVLRERNDKQQYGSTEAFLSDLSWIQHNMQIVEAEDPNLIQCAKQMYKKGKKQLSEIDLCYECYINIQYNEKWFELACSKPHLLVWAKLKGYPYWPAKVFANASLVNQVLVLFFGAHDRATIAPKDCFLFSEQDPNNKPAKRPTWDTSMNEARAHISRLIERFGTFRYAENHTPLDVRRVDECTKNMIPGAFASLHSTVERIGAADGPIARPPAGSGDGSEPHSSTDCAAKTKLTMKILKNSGKVVAISSLTTPEASGPATNIEFPSGGGTSTTGEKLSDDTAGSGASGSLHSQPAPPEVHAIKRITRRMSRKSVSAKEYDSAVEDQSVRGTGSFVELRKKRKSVGVMDTEKRLEQQQQQQQQPSQPRESDKVESLLIRRNSATWETEPISKRRKSTAKHRDRPKTLSGSGANQGAEGGRETSEHEAGSQVTRLMTTGKEPESFSISLGKILLRRKSVARCLLPLHDAESPVDAAPSLPVDNGSTMPSAVDEPPLQGPSTVSPPQPGTSDLVETDESLNVTTEIALLDPNMMIPAEIKQEPVSEPEDNLSTAEELSSVQLAETVAEPRNTRRSISTDTSNSAQQCAVDQGLASGKDDTPVPQSRNKSKETDVDSSFQLSVVGQRARKTFPAGNKNAPKHVGSSATSTGGSTDPKQTPVPHMVNIPNPLPTSLGNGFKPEFTITGSRAAMAEPGIVGPAVSILTVSNTGGNSSNGCAVTPVPTPTTSANDPTSTPVSPATGVLSSPIATTKIEKQYGASSEHLPSSATDVTGEADVESLANLRPPPLQAKPTGAPIPGNAGEVMAVSQSRSPPTVSNLVVQASGRMADYCQRLLEEMLTEFTSQGSLEAKMAQLHLELENAEKRHQLERASLTQEHAKQLTEQRLQLEREKDAAMREVRQNAAAEKDRAVALAKKTQWCKRCPKEAMYYCCWNTSYCDPNCQQSDWSSHQKVCTQVQNRAERPLGASGGGSTVGSGSPDNSGAASADVIVLDDSPVRAGSAGRKRPSARISPSSGAKARLIPRCSLNGPITFTRAMQISDVVGNATEMHGERRQVSSGVVLPSSSAGPVNATPVRITMPANRPTPPVIAPRRSTSQQTAERPKSNSSTTQNNPYMRERLFNNNSIASLDSGPSRLTAYTVLSAHHTGATTGAGPRVWNQFYLPSTSDYTRNDATRRAALPNGT